MSTCLMCGTFRGHSFTTYTPEEGSGSSVLRTPMYCCHSDVMICAYRVGGWVYLKSGNLCVRAKWMTPYRKSSGYTIMDIEYRGLWCIVQHKSHHWYVYVMWLQNLGTALILNGFGILVNPSNGVESILSVPSSGRILNLWLIIAVKM